MNTSRLSSDFARFWSKVAISGPNECWNWTAGTFALRGCYGQFSQNGKPNYASRVAWTFVHGAIPDGMCVLHTCDNPKCVNLRHLFLGNRNDNVQDMISKNRQFHRTACGENNWKSKVTDQKVRNIRCRYANGETQYALAKAFHVSQTTISKIVLKQTWKHVS